MLLAQAVAGALAPGQEFPWVYEDQATGAMLPIADLTGATISGTLRPRDTRIERAIAGALSVVDGPAARVRWEYAAADVVGGYYDVRFKADMPGIPTPHISFWTPWYVEP